MRVGLHRVQQAHSLKSVKDITYPTADERFGVDVRGRAEGTRDLEQPRAVKGYRRQIVLLCWPSF